MQWSSGISPGFSGFVLAARARVAGPLSPTRRQGRDSASIPDQDTDGPGRTSTARRRVRGSSWYATRHCGILNDCDGTRWARAPLGTRSVSLGLSSPRARGAAVSAQAPVGLSVAGRTEPYRPIARSCEAWASSRVSPRPTAKFTPIGSRTCTAASSNSAKCSPSSRVM